jgi:ribosomal protein S6--L-glutamate ligase
LTDSKLRVAVVGVPGGWSSEALADAFSERTGFRHLVDMGEVHLDLEKNALYSGDVNLCELDAVVVKKAGEVYSPDMLDRLELLRFVHDTGTPVFSNPHTMLRLLDRLSCTVTLRAAGIPMPPTVVTESCDQAVAAIQRFGSAVLKPLYSTKARGMELLEADDADLREKVEAFRAAGNPVIYLQQKLDLPDRDLGMIFLGGEHIGTYARVSGGAEWNTTIRAGGHYAAHEPKPESLAIAQRAQAAFDLAFTSVDVVELESGPVVFEVSAFGGFRGLRDGLGIDAAARYADWVLAQVST